MARLSYSAPGVYVEEVPSARQPIAGVGTNTAGFIGLVRNVIYVPVPNPDYDPILTRNLLEFARLDTQSRTSGPEAAMAREELDQERERLQRELATRQADHQTLVAQKKTEEDGLRDAQTALTTAQPAAGTAPDAITDDQARTLRDAQSSVQAARNKLSATQRNFDNSQQAIDAIQRQLDGVGGPPVAPAPMPTPAAAPAAAGAVTGGSGQIGQEADEERPEIEQDYEDVDLDADSPLLMPSVLRPYYLQKREVKAPALATKLCTNFSEYAALFGDFSAFSEIADDNAGGSQAGKRFRPLNPGHHMLTHAVNGFFANGGTRCFVARVAAADTGQLRKALENFTSIEDLGMLAAPGLPKDEVFWGELETYCEDDAHPNVFAILDSPGVVNDGKSNALNIDKLRYEALQRTLPRKSTHAAYYFPHIEVMDPAKRLQDTDPARNVAPKYRGRAHVVPSGHVAGIYARTDEERGVHKAPANAVVRGALEVKYYVSKPKQELLNPQGVNCIRLMNGDVTVWGARTIGGDRNGEWKYVSVRRFAGFLKTSIDRGTQWVVFEPNDPSLWSKIILNVSAFLTNVWRSGALFGLTPAEAFYVKCDAELNPPEVRDLGQVITEIGVAIVRPAEFVIFRITQSTGENR